MRRKKYQRILVNVNFLKLRNSGFKYITSSEKTLQKCCDSNFFQKNINKKNFLIFYKKFNSNLQLKEKYNLNNFKKKNNKNACFCSYIYFANHLIKYSKVNNIQKLNTLLKINDLLLLLFNPKKHTFFLKDFSKLINLEKKFLIKYL